MIVKLSTERSGTDMEVDALAEPPVPGRTSRHAAQVIPFFARPGRPPCRVPGCRTLSDEARLCRPHLILWRHAGSPEDVDVWARAYARRRDETGATRTVRVQFPDLVCRQKRPIRTQKQEVDWEQTPEEVFEA